MIAGGVATSDWWLMSRPNIKTAEQLRGGSVATAVFGGTSDSFARIALKRLGLTPVKDVAILQIGGLAERLSSLETGRVHAAMLATPDVFIAQKKGFLRSSACDPALPNHVSCNYPQIHSGKS
jgi:NitT/TauT family transport system substrate-binding protein